MKIKFKIIRFNAENPAVEVVFFTDTVILDALNIGLPPDLDMSRENITKHISMYAPISMLQAKEAALNMTIDYSTIEAMVSAEIEVDLSNLAATAALNQPNTSGTQLL